MYDSETDPIRIAFSALGGVAQQEIPAIDAMLSVIKTLLRPLVNPYHIPQIPEGAQANGINDVHVDENGIMYVVERLQGGLYILELNP